MSLLPPRKGRWDATRRSKEVKNTKYVEMITNWWVGRMFGHLMRLLKRVPVCVQALRPVSKLTFKVTEHWFVVSEIGHLRRNMRNFWTLLKLIFFTPPQTLISLAALYITTELWMYDLKCKWCFLNWHFRVTHPYKSQHLLLTRQWAEFHIKVHIKSQKQKFASKVWFIQMMSAICTRPVRGVKGAGTSEKNNYGKLSLHGLSKGQCCTTAVHTHTYHVSNM